MRRGRRFRMAIGGRNISIAGRFVLSMCAIEEANHFKRMAMLCGQMGSGLNAVFGRGGVANLSLSQWFAMGVVTPVDGDRRTARVWDHNKSRTRNKKGNFSRFWGS